METSAITSAFLASVGAWNGCRWPTKFGNLGLNLQGLRPSQAALMARSTAGREAADWKAAVRWLEQVERDAAAAQEEAELAADLAILGQLAQALEHAQRACALEEGYGSEPVWQTLRNAIADSLRKTQSDGVKPTFPVAGTGNKLQVHRQFPGDDHVSGTSLCSGSRHGEIRGIGSNGCSENAGAEGRNARRGEPVV